MNNPYTYQNLRIDIDEGSDGLYGLRVTDLNTGAVWWATICETRQDAVAAVELLFKDEAARNLQRQLDYVNLTDKGAKS